MPATDPKQDFCQIDDLLFDPENPRLPSTIDASDNAAVIEWMLQNANIIELMGSIGAKGFYPAEPLLVVASESKPGKYEVVEGNRRLTAALLLAKPQLAKIRKSAVLEAADSAEYIPNRLPVLIYEERQDILDYLGYRHITGVKPWSALAKAKYLRELRQSLPRAEADDQYKALAKQIGSRPDYVKLLLTGVSVMDKVEEEAYYKIKGLNEEAIDFGVLYTALRKPNIANFLGIRWEDADEPAREVEKEHLGELIRWMFERSVQGVTRLGESRNIAQLDSVIGNAKALAAFRDGRSLSEAALLTEQPYIVFQELCNDARNKLREAQSNIHLIDDFDQGDYENTLELVKLARTILNTVRAKLEALEGLE